MKIMSNRVHFRQQSRNRSFNGRTVSLDMKTTEEDTDRNISLTAGWNLIGYSSNETNLSLSSATFHNGSNSYTWAEALSNGKQQAYLSYYDNNANANLSKYKYLSAVSGLDDTAFRNKKGYWIYSNVSGNLTLPSVGGSTSGQSYYVSELRFSNGSLEKTYLNAIIADWIEIPQYRDTDTNSFQVVTGNLNSWQGYFFKSNIDNLTLIRQN